MDRGRGSLVILADLPMMKKEYTFKQGSLPERKANTVAYCSRLRDAS